MSISQRHVLQLTEPPHGVRQRAILHASKLATRVPAQKTRSAHLKHAQVNKAPVACALHFAQRIARARHPRLVHRRLALHKREQRTRPCDRFLLAFVWNISISDVIEDYAGVIGIVEGGRSTPRWWL